MGQNVWTYTLMYLLFGAVFHVLIKKGNIFIDGILMCQTSTLGVELHSPLSLSPPVGLFVGLIYSIKSNNVSIVFRLYIFCMCYC